ncbi:glycosyltransferase family 4 protein [Methylobacterium oxalidis]|uniref:glycosyltransferase family 4 protein n=1 Tax=Methylobacterium oxalidis TaxID=944322 RepID=UPI001EE06E84|nr:glycosyltransferase family 4 protein [Methylobacterium oxalidis]
MTIYENCSLGGIISVIRERMRVLQPRGLEEYFYFMRDRGGVASLQAEGARHTFLGHLGIDNNIYNLVKSEEIPCVTLFSHFHLARNLKREGLKVYLELHDCPPATVAPVGALKGFFDKVVVPSAWSRDWVNAEAGIPPQDIEIVPNFINTDIFYSEQRTPLSTSHPRPMLWVGRLDERKNWRDAVYIASLLKKRGLRVRPVFVLSLRYEDEYVHDFMDQIALLGIDEDVRVYYNLSQADLAGMMRDFAHQGGCFLSTARLESFGLGIVEALACGLPVVASAVGAVPEHVVHGDSGYLFAFGERVAAADLVEECLFVRKSRERVLAGMKHLALDAKRSEAVEQLVRMFSAGSGGLSDAPLDLPGATIAQVG